MATNCNLAGCGDSGDVNKLVNALPYSNISPWVRVTFKKSDYGITVGNESTKREGGGYYYVDGKINSAVIASFQYGATAVNGGCGCKITVIDEQGGNFDKFMQNLIKEVKDNKIKEAYAMSVKWGWTASPCGRLTALGSQSLGSRYTSEEFNFIPYNVTCDFTGGQVKFNLQGIDPGNAMLGSVSEEKVQGSDIQRLKLKDAIRKLFANHGINVKFLKKNPKTGEISEWKFRDGGDGPEQKWPTNQTDPISVAMNWLRDFRTEDNKSFTTGTDPTEKEPTIIFWEAFVPDCDGNYKGKGPNGFGTYLINAGACSPVISFSPSIQWVFLQNQGGGSSGNSGEQAKAESKLDCDSPASGTRTALPISEQAADVYGKEAIKEVADSAAAAQKASAYPFQPITAELKIQGDPKLASPISLINQMVSLVVINPFHLDLSDLGGCSSWLAKPVCNPIFTNKNWLIQGVDHQIKEGSYVTTLQLMLGSPGVHFKAGVPLGGQDSNGATL